MYHLEQAPEVLGGEYRFRLTEQHDDLSHFDRVELLAVDHPPGTEVCVLPGGDIRTYAVGALPGACYSESGADLLDLVSGADDDVAVVETGSWVEAEFPFSGRADGGVGAKGGPGQKIPPWGGRGGREGDGNTFDLTPLCFRANPTTNIMPMPADVVHEGDHIRLRFTSPTEFRIDQLFLADIGPAEPIIAECGLLSAHHSGTGPCLDALVDDDDVRIDLLRGEVIELSFAAPEADSGFVRDFVLVTEGHYASGEEHRTFEETAPSVARISDPHPNPFSVGTTVRFEIPAPGGHVLVRVYALSGRLVRELRSDVLPGGSYESTWDGRDSHGERAGSGVYFYQMDAPGLRGRRKIVLLR